MLEIEKKQIAYNRSSRTKTIRYIVIHDTGNRKEGADADNHFEYFNGGDRQSSADFFVDDTKILQVNSFKAYYTWHCGDGKGAYGIYNSNSLGIEICINSDGDYDKAFQNAVSLTKFLMQELGIDADHVVRHYDASRKNCPQTMNNNGDWSKWEEFKNKLGEEVNDVSKFKDIEGHYAQKHIEKLEGYGIVNGIDGDGDGSAESFKPDEPITRADAAIMIANALTICGK